MTIRCAGRVQVKSPLDHGRAHMKEVEEGRLLPEPVSLYLYYALDQRFNVILDHA